MEDKITLEKILDLAIISMTSKINALSEGEHNYDAALTASALEIVKLRVMHAIRDDEVVESRGELETLFTAVSLTFFSSLENADHFRHICNDYFGGNEHDARSYLKALTLLLPKIQTEFVRGVRLDAEFTIHYSSAA